ncbi:MAG: hypothetical protein ABIQ44_09735 [Chloroflexia bacterium]
MDTELAAAKERARLRAYHRALDQARAAAMQASGEAYKDVFDQTLDDIFATSFPQMCEEELQKDPFTPNQIQPSS